MARHDFKKAGAKHHIHNHIFDTRLWDQITLRSDDIIIASYPKSGTTWLQQIVGQLVFEGKEIQNLSKISPWLDRLAPTKKLLNQRFTDLENQTHRRFIKTHAPANTMPQHSQIKRLFIARHGIDVLWSLYNHHSNFTNEFYKMTNNTYGHPSDMEAFRAPTENIKSYYHQWLGNDGKPFFSLWDTLRSWWNVRNDPNVMILHYNNLKHDLAGEIDKIAAFLDIKIQPQNRAKIIEHCTFKYMKTHADTVSPAGGSIWQGGGKTFINKGENGQWRSILTPNEVKMYEDKAKKELGTECNHWLTNGNNINKAPALRIKNNYIS